MLPYRFVVPAALIALAPLSMLAAQTAITPPRAVPLSETVHGITLSDEYRWMEDPTNKAEWTGWVSAQGQRTRAMLDGLPQRAQFITSIRQVGSSLSREGAYQQAGTTEIWTRALPGDPTPKLIARTPAGTRVLVDPAKALGNDLAAMGAITLAPDGRTVAVHLSSGGAEIGSTHFYDVATGKETGAPVPNMWGEEGIVFLPAGMIAYQQLAEAPDPTDPLKASMVWVRPLAGGAAKQIMGGTTGGADLSDAELPKVFDSDNSPFVLGYGGGARADFKIYAMPRNMLVAGTPAWQPIATLDDKIGSASLRGTSLYLLSAHDNPARTVQVRQLDVAGRAGPATTVLAGHDKLILTDVVAARDGVYIFATTDGASRLFFTSGGRTAVKEVTLPFEGAAFWQQALADGSGVTFGLSGWTHNNTAIKVRGGVVRPTGIAAQSWSGASAFAAERYAAISQDGTSVPLVVLRRKGAHGPEPTLLEGYGGYGVDTAAPFYDRYGMAWLSHGGVLAYCGTRGGGERGRSWHEGGRGHNKPRAMEDLIACAEMLSAKGIAPARGPVLTSASMGGTLIPTAALRKPGSFGGMILTAGVVNTSRIAFAENGANQFGEIGDPADPAQFADLVAMDGYQMLPAASGLPPSMLLIGLNDHRVPPWMTAKFVARAQAKWPGAPIWLRSDDKAGHGVGSTEDVRVAEHADEYAFAWWAEARP